MKPLRLLLVDDEADFVESLGKRLRRRGIACDGAGCAAEALAKLAAAPYDVVLLDMLLPDKNGNEILPAIKAQWPATQVIILTGHASVAAGKESLRHGAADYLMKPLEMETLFDKLTALAGRPDDARYKQGASTGVPTGGEPFFSFQPNYGG
ncbi:MAG TPA: response regulator [Desulfurivibrionaceae bacterium]|nr:response regulator [Desulfurivibrionaceae bacterium]